MYLFVHNFYQRVWSYFFHFFCKDARNPAVNNIFKKYNQENITTKRINNHCELYYKINITPVVVLKQDALLLLWS